MAGRSRTGPTPRATERSLAPIGHVWNGQREGYDQRIVTLPIHEDRTFIDDDIETDDEKEITPVGNHAERRVSKEYSGRTALIVVLTDCVTAVHRRVQPLH